IPALPSTAGVSSPRSSTRATASRGWWASSPPSSDCGRNVERDGCRCPGVTWPRLTGDHHMTDLTTLRSTTDAELLFPGDAAYEAVRPVYYGAGDPAAIIRPTTTEQVADALRLAREQRLGVSVRSGGHAAKVFPNPDGLVIDMAGFDAIEVRSDGTVRVGTGATWGRVAQALEPHGLVITSGDTRDV